MPLEWARKNLTLIFLYKKKKILWNDDYAQLYYNAMLAQEVQEKFDFASRLIDRDVNEALKVFNEVLKQ